MRWFLLLLLPFLLFAEKSDLLPSLAKKMEKAGLIDVNVLEPSILTDFKYASENNFLKKNVYGDLKKCYLHKIAAEKLAQAQKNLQEAMPGFKLIVFDCVRPRSIQYMMWEVVKGTDLQGYVADPKRGSIHNYGFAVDLSIGDETGKELDMGTAFDYFGDLSQPVLESRFLKEKKLLAGQVKNRELLRKVMNQAGFLGIANEWWHFEALPKKAVIKNYTIIE